MNTRHSSRLVEALAAATACVGLLGAAVYAFKPMTPRAAPPADLPEPALRESTPPTLFNLAAFDAPLWIDAPPPPPPPAAAPAP